MKADRTQPSATALLVALSVLRCGPAHGLPEVCTTLAKQALMASSRGWQLLALLAQVRWGRVLLNVIEQLGCGGLARHHCQRKAWLQRRLQAAPLPDQWLWLGSGFDALGLAANAQQPSIRLLELDHPATLARRKSLAIWRAYAPEHQALCLPEQASALRILCRNRPSTLIAEGVLMYLPARSVLRLLVGLSRLAEPPRLLFSALDGDRETGAGFHRQSALRLTWLARCGEPFRWRLSATTLIRLLQRRGYRVSASWSGSGFGEYMIDATFVGASVDASPLTLAEKEIIY